MRKVIDIESKRIQEKVKEVEPVFQKHVNWVINKMMADLKKFISLRIKVTDSVKADLEALETEIRTAETYGSSMKVINSIIECAKTQVRKLLWTEMPDALAFWRSYELLHQDTVNPDDIINNYAKAVDLWESVPGMMTCDETGKVISCTDELKEILCITEGEDLTTAVRERALKLYNKRLAMDEKQRKIEARKRKAEKRKVIMAKTKIKQNTIEYIKSLVMQCDDFVEKYTERLEDETVKELYRKISDCKTELDYEKIQRDVMFCLTRISAEYLGKRDAMQADLFYEYFKQMHEGEIDPYDIVGQEEQKIKLWKRMNSLFTIEEKGLVKPIYKDNINSLAGELANVFYGKNVDTSTMTKEEKLKMINEILCAFVENTQTQKLVKDQIPLIKISHTDLNGMFDTKKNSKGIVVYDKTSKLSFDTRKASKITAEEIKHEKDGNSLRIINTSESGITRMLVKDGIKFVTINVRDTEMSTLFGTNRKLEIKPDWFGAFKDITDKSLKNQVILQRAIKTKVFKNGVYDEEGRKYLPAFQSPASKRQTNFFFIEAKKPEDVQKYWLKITDYEGWTGKGFKEDLRALLMALGSLNEDDDDIYLNMSKFIARLAILGSNNIDIGKVSPEFDKLIKEANVIYTNDVDIIIDRPWKEMTGPGKMENAYVCEETKDKNGNTIPVLDDKGQRKYILDENGNKQYKKRKLTLGDGQMIGSITFHAKIAAGMGRISKDEYNLFLKLWNRPSVGRDADKVQPGSKLKQIIKRIPAVVQIRHGAKKGISVMYNLEKINQEIEYTYTRKINGEKIQETKKVNISDLEVIVPDSVRKFEDGEWADHSLYVCQYLKPKDGLVNINPQFWQSLEFDDCNRIAELGEYWLKYMEQSTQSLPHMLEFFHMKGGTDDNLDEDGNPEENTRTEQNLAAALKANPALMNEVKVRSWIFAKYQKQIDNLKIGRVKVPGMYTYMVCDPGYIIAKTFGINVPHLQSGENYHNNMDCNVGAFRSPLIHPAEVQKLKCVPNRHLWYLKDVMVFNGIDGLWDLMGGADFDGDTCAVVPETGVFSIGGKTYYPGRWIVDGIRHFDYDISETAFKAKQVPFSWNEYINHLVESANTDRVGIITNFGTKAMDVANHLRGIKQLMREEGCTQVFFKHPDDFNNRKDPFYKRTDDLNGCNFSYIITNMKDPRKETEEKTLIVRGFIAYEWDPNARGYLPAENPERDALGFFNFWQEDELQTVIDNYEDDVMIIKLLQGREIDGAKTGVYAEGAFLYMGRNDYIPGIMYKYTSRHLLDSNVYKGRVEIKNNKIPVKVRVNLYRSLSPLGRLNDYINENASKMVYSHISRPVLKPVYQTDEHGCPVRDMNGRYIQIGTEEEMDYNGYTRYESDGISMLPLLQMLLTDKEKKDIIERDYQCNYWVFTGPKSKELMTKGKLVDILKSKREEYNSTIKQLREMQSNPELKEANGFVDETMAQYTERVYEELVEFANQYGISKTTMAAGAYWACHDDCEVKKSKQSGFAWILIDKLLAIFSRANKRYNLYPIPGTDIEDVRVQNKFLVVNGKNCRRVNAPDCNMVNVECINGHYYAVVRKNASNIMPYNIGSFEGLNINLGMMGYGQYIDNLDKTASPARYKAAADKLMAAITQNNNEFCIVMGPDYGTCIAARMEGRWQIVANICSCREQSRSVNQIVWKKYRITNGTAPEDIIKVGDPKKKDTWTWKSFRNVKAECIGIADEQAIKLIGEDNPLIEGMFPEHTEE